MTMDVALLNQLARRLIELSRLATADPGSEPAPPGELLVLTDITEHPGSSIGEIAARTGFGQSHVSGCVHRLTDRGLLTVLADPADRRRTLTRATDVGILTCAVQRRAADPFRQAVGVLLGDGAGAERACRLLEELTRMLLPDRAGSR